VSEDRRIDMTYAHFHRVLGGLLSELSELPGVLWLSDERHVLRGEGEHNSYARAVYRVKHLGPYRQRLSELEEVQKQGMATLGLPKPPRELLLPQVIEDVTQVQLGKKIDAYRSTRVAKEVVLAKMETALCITRKNLTEFQRYGTQDDGVKRLGAEVKVIEEAREAVVQAEEDVYRLRIKGVRYRLYVYRGAEGPVTVDCRLHGLIVAGPKVEISHPTRVRRTRNDQRNIEPLFEFGKTSIYLERDWQEAGR